eukprot:1158122-Pelagomonas_calceolata.AAC.20
MLLIGAATDTHTYTHTERGSSRCVKPSQLERLRTNKYGHKSETTTHSARVQLLQGRSIDGQIQCRACLLWVGEHIGVNTGH